MRVAALASVTAAVAAVAVLAAAVVVLTAVRARTGVAADGHGSHGPLGLGLGLGLGPGGAVIGTVRVRSRAHDEVQAACDDVEAGKTVIVEMLPEAERQRLERAKVVCAGLALATDADFPLCPHLPTSMPTVQRANAAFKHLHHHLPGAWCLHAPPLEHQDRLAQGKAAKRKPDFFPVPRHSNDWPVCNGVELHRLLTSDLGGACVSHFGSTRHLRTTPHASAGGVPFMFVAATSRATLNTHHHHVHHARVLGGEAKSDELSLIEIGEWVRPVSAGDDPYDYSHRRRQQQRPWQDQDNEDHGASLGRFFCASVDTILVVPSPRARHYVVHSVTTTSVSGPEVDGDDQDDFGDAAVAGSDWDSDVVGRQLQGTRRKRGGSGSAAGSGKRARAASDPRSQGPDEDEADAAAAAAAAAAAPEAAERHTRGTRAKFTLVDASKEDGGPHFVAHVNSMEAAMTVIRDFKEFLGKERKALGSQNLRVMVDPRNPRDAGDARVTRTSVANVATLKDNPAAPDAGLAAAVDGRVLFNIAVKVLDKVFRNVVLERTSLKAWIGTALDWKTRGAEHADKMQALADKFGTGQVTIIQLRKVNVGRTLGRCCASAAARPPSR